MHSYDTTFQGGIAILKGPIVTTEIPMFTLHGSKLEKCNISQRTYVNNLIVVNGMTPQYVLFNLIHSPCLTPILLRKSIRFCLKIGENPYKNNPYILIAFS
jgi:hypothetical protein